MNLESITLLFWAALFKGGLALLLGLGGVLLFKRVPASVRHWICGVALASALLVPVLTWLVPTWSLAILPDAPTTEFNPIQKPQTQTEPMMPAPAAEKIPVLQNLEWQDAAKKVQ